MIHPLRPFALPTRISTVLVVVAALVSASPSGWWFLPHGAIYPTPPPVEPPPAPPPAPPPPSPPPPAPTPPSTPGPAPSSPTGGARPTSSPTGGSSGPAQGPGTGGGKGTAPTTVGTPPRLPGPGTGAMSLNTGPDPASWEWWWFYNQDRFLELKSHVDARGGAAITESDFFGTGSTSNTPTADLIAERVVPALLGVLASDAPQGKPVDLVTSAMIGLARMSDGPIAKRAGEFGRVFATYVDDPSQEVRETSVLARGLAGDESAMFELVDVLEDGASARRANGGKEIAWRTRSFAAYALGFLGAHSKNEDLRRFVVHHLVHTLRGDESAVPDIQVACVVALSVTPLAWSEAEDADVRVPTTPAAARKMSNGISATRETQIECLLAKLGDPNGDRRVRAQVPGALARLLHDAGAAPLEGIVATEFPVRAADPRRQAVREEITRALLVPLANGSREVEEVVQGCVLALGRIADGDRDATDVKVRAVLQATASGGDALSRRFALVALAQSATRPGADGSHAAADDARAFLLSRLADGKSPERCWAALAIGLGEHARLARGDERSIAVDAAMLAALRGAGSPEEIGALAIASGLMRNREATAELLARLDRTGDPRASGHVAVALGLLGDEKALAPLRAQLSKARFQPELLRDTAVGLALLEDSTLVDALVSTLQKATSLASQSSAASVLGWIGDRDAIAPLLKLLGDPGATATARAFAAVALGRVCDRDRLPWNALVAEDIHYRASPSTLASADGTGVLDIL